MPGRSVKRRPKPIKGKGLIRDTKRFMKKHEKAIGTAVGAAAMGMLLLGNYNNKMGGSKPIRGISGGYGKPLSYHF